MWTEEQKSRKVRTAEAVLDAARVSAKVSADRLDKRRAEAGAAADRAAVALDVANAKVDLVVKAMEALEWAKGMPTMDGLPVEGEAPAGRVLLPGEVPLPLDIRQESDGEVPWEDRAAAFDAVIQAHVGR